MEVRAEVRNRVSEVEEGARKIFEERMQVLRDLTAADEEIDDIEEKIAALGKSRVAKRKARKQLYEQAVRDGWKPHDLEFLNFAAEPGRARGRPRGPVSKQRKTRGAARTDPPAAAIAGEETDPSSEESQQQEAPTPSDVSWSTPHPG
ncbi:hypothetical protein OG339_48005 (plasmid) [Streptosporangium sp. NBC_01495]|uniref:hypothetical protein n=1 Tax=Streptosporangium sp. NBC_01495 TaxID=2903899 RepID=UPI002E2F9E72|nr:hypothetical protein [Streptosporangium sp. NBC_01495]